MCLSELGMGCSYIGVSRGQFLETPDNFLDPVSIFWSTFIYQLMVIIGANLEKL